MRASQTGNRPCLMHTYLSSGLSHARVECGEIPEESASSSHRQRHVTGPAHVSFLVVVSIYVFNGKKKSKNLRHSIFMSSTVKKSQRIFGIPSYAGSAPTATGRTWRQADGIIFSCTDSLFPSGWRMMDEAGGPGGDGGGDGGEGCFPRLVARKKKNFTFLFHALLGS